ncbi:replication restart helicase PriA [Rubellicoccus peritrichatus]|uniref:Replication restart protein PriA n=1 Tax=Rubellicoccus peritrichatus TaxID=3080537 RepID=A0AAQ3L7C3_9BACT|nr:primosomal protein N' [Puniceicoccus sp. CR14]WOO40331.1 primosomal protein N' [Puniceicoccus sp. CR14]
MNSTDRLIEVMPIAGIETPLAYAVPSGVRGCMEIGALVRIPLQNRTCLGVVVREGSDQKVPAGKLKYVIDGLFNEPVLTPELITLSKWMRRYYAASVESVFETMIPSAVRQEMSPKMHRLLSVRQVLNDEELQALDKRAPKQAEVYRFVQQQPLPVARGLIMGRLKVSAASIDSLTKKNILTERAEREERVVYSDVLSNAEKVSEVAVELTEEQAAAEEDIAASIAAGEFRVHLLHGVTGSGKTEVYLHAMRRVLDSGGSIVYLVPEVALTPQTVSRLRGRFEQAGDKIVVWHSHLSNGERLDAWMTLARGEARVVVGARSAIFAPIQNLRLVVVDEEHEPAYKQAETPRYHGRDVAVYRAMLSKAVCVLGSATPSLESLYNIQTKNYRVNRLTKRIDDRQLPIVHLVDMRRERLNPDGSANISAMLAEKLQDRQDKAEQSILFLNRRGYSSSMNCPDCGFVAMCEHCDVMLTYHRPEQQLKCHICGFHQPAPSGCPQCKSSKVRWRGYGTQRIEEVIGKIVPGAKIVRLDTDTMSKKNLFRKILGDFRTGKIDILIGTQMIAKGLDFPNVTLVGLVDADVSLHIPDFRAAERTFQLLVQVSGRAGRGDKAGEVVVQTLMPHSPPIQYARQADFDGFLDAELEQRREFNYPPYRHLVRHLFRGRNPEKVQFYAEQWAKKLEKELTEPIEIRGPVAAPLEKMKDQYRFHLWYFVGNVSRTLPYITAIRDAFKLDDDVIDVLDVDPVDMV